MSAYYGSYGYGDLYPPSIGLAWGTTTAGEEMKKALTKEGIALFMSLREQIMQPVPGQNRLVIRPSVAAGVRTWWQTTTAPLFSYFGDWIQHGPIENVVAWTIRLAQLRREAAQLGLLVLPSTYLEAWGAAHGAAPTVGQTVGPAPSIDSFRAHAQRLANEVASSVVGVIHVTTPAPNGVWQALPIHSTANRDGRSATQNAYDWLITSTRDQSAFTYAAFFDKEDANSWPKGRPFLEAISDRRTSVPWSYDRARRF